MTPILNAILHGGPGMAPTVPEYLGRVLLHLVAFVGLAGLVRMAIDAVSATRAVLEPGGRSGAADR